MKSRFEEMGGTYTEIEGIFYPNLALPEPELRPIGKWGMMHEIYLREHKPFTYTNLLTTCKLDSYLADINEQAMEMMEQIITHMAKAEGVSEELKATDQMKWVRQMNSIRNQGEEVVKADLIYA